MEEGGNCNQNMSISSDQSVKDNEEVIDNYSYEEYNSPDNNKQEEQNNNERKFKESNESNEEIEMLREKEINKVEELLNQQSKRSKNEETQKEEDSKPIKEQEEIVIVENDQQEEFANKVDKTIFSKLSEEMYNNIVKQWNNNNNFNYDEFINECFLETYSDKINGDNNKKIKDFMERNESYNRHKYYTLETLNHREEQIKAIRNEKDEIKMNKKRCAEMFIEKQFNYIKNKKNIILQLQKEQEQSQKKELREVPTINKRSKLYPYKAQQTKKIVFSKNNSKNIEPLKEDTKQTKQAVKLTEKEIKKVVEKLYQNNHILPKETKCIQKCKSCSLFNYTSNQSTINNHKSISLLIEILINHIKKEIETIKNETFKTNIAISNNEFKQILYSMGYIPPNMQTDNLLSRSNDISQVIWNSLLKLNKDDLDNIQVNTLIIFLLTIEGFIKEKKILKFNYPWLNLNNDNYNYFKSKEIKKNYSSLVAHRKKNIEEKKKKKHLMKSSSSASLFEPSFKPKLNLASSTNYLYKALHSEINYRLIHRLKLSQSYNIIPTKHHEKMLQLKDDFEKQALVECTFYPNNRIPIKRSVSNEVSNRLYSSALNQLIKNKLKIIANQSPLNIPIQNVFRKEAYNQQMFNSNPISDDYLFSKCIERYEKTRLEKQLINDVKTKGIYSIEQLRVLAEHDHYKREIIKGKEFRFDNEIETNKESFDKFNKNNQKQSQLKKIKTNKKELLFSFEIKIQNRKTILNYYKHDIPGKIVADFAKKYHLSLESKKQILTVLIDRLTKCK